MFPEFEVLERIAVQNKLELVLTIALNCESIRRCFHASIWLLLLSKELQLRNSP